MIIDREISKYIIHIDTSLSQGLEKIASVKGRVLFGVDDNNQVHGVLTNGDLIRWLNEKKNRIDFNTSIRDVLNKNFVYLYESAPSIDVEKRCNEVLFVPILDQHQHLLAVASKTAIKNDQIFVGSREISDKSPVYVIAEIGNNHNGDLQRAYRLIEQAVKAGADCAKFQMRNLTELYANEGDADDAKENLGSQYTLDLLNKYQLNPDELFLAFDYCKMKGIEPLCTPWDIKSAELLEEYGVSAYKIASADLTNHELIRFLMKTGKPLILSTGMSSELEITQTVDLLKSKGTQFALLHCNSCYPPPFKDVNLKYIQRLKDIGNSVVGYSGHERDIFVAVAAVSCGAQIIEKHFTENVNLEGSDHKISLLPEQFSRMVEGIRQVESALGSNDKREVSQGEDMNRTVLAKSIFIDRNIEEGDEILAQMLTVKSPGHGLQPNYLNDLIGRKSKRKMQKGDVFYVSDLKDNNVIARKYNFNRRWGLPVRFHDYKDLWAKSNPSLLEFHLSYKDLEVDLDKYLDKDQDIDIVVHSPELFKGDHVLDLCSVDESYRNKSVDELQNVLNFSRKLGSYFKKSTKIGVVTNVGGFSEHKRLDGKERSLRLQNLKRSLTQLDVTGVEVLPQTMPPYPWHFGGQRHHNLFVDVDEIVQFCQEMNYRVCLDVSHTKLATNELNKSFVESVNQIAPYVAHMHFADAKGIDDEGLQIGEGEIDFASLANALDTGAPNASFIPEIWQGHENSGEGFWCALEKLEQYF